MLMVATTVRGQSASHWGCDPHAFQYDMTAYLQLKSGGKVLTDYTDYEIAAFCGEECRGVATVLTVEQPLGGDIKVARIRVRSNTASGDEIRFVIYKKSTGTETFFNETIVFESLTVEGSPSEPLILQLSKVLPGDANGDGSIDVTDIVGIANSILGRPSESFDAVAADVNGDGSVDVTDIVVVANIILHDGGTNAANVRGAMQMLDPQ